jgi:1-deoxy-D-xylulose 5-phosphate reductoisomerase
MNAANEEAVQAFIDGRLSLTEIPHIIEGVMNKPSERTCP